MDRYHIYLLHIWTEQLIGEERDVIVRGALEEPHTGRRWAFHDVEGLVKYLKYILADVAKEGSEEY